jgi:hypothetical protein
MSAVRSRQRAALTRAYLFVCPGDPWLLSRDLPMSENTVNSALRCLGYSDHGMNGPGFRGMTTTLLNKKG